MFQYAFGYCLAKEKKDDLAFDVKFYENQPKHVGKRSVQIEEYFNLSRFKVINRPKEVDFYENKLVNKAIRIVPGFHVKASSEVFFVKERSRRYMKTIPYRAGMINYYDGYWLTSLYFKDYEDEIRKEFSFREEVTPLCNNAYANIHESSVAIHVRRGDFLGKKNMPGSFSEKSITEYYHRAIHYFETSTEHPCFYVFSDDIPWCKSQFGDDDNFVYVENEGNHAAILDMYGMHLCKCGIMSPSTFGWWGNWLRKEQGVVIAPKGNYNNDHFRENNWMEI